MSEERIAKYRDPAHPDRWYLTYFTMEQIERHIDYLEREVERLRARIRTLESNLPVCCEAARAEGYREGMEEAAKLPMPKDPNINGWVAILTEFGAFKTGWRRYAAAIRAKLDEGESET